MAKASKWGLAKSPITKCFLGRKQSRCWTKVCQDIWTQYKGRVANGVIADSGAILAHAILVECTLGPWNLGQDLIFDRVKTENWSALEDDLRTLTSYCPPPLAQLAV